MIVLELVEIWYGYTITQMKELSSAHVAYIIQLLIQLQRIYMIACFSFFLFIHSSIQAFPFMDEPEEL